MGILWNLLKENTCNLLVQQMLSKFTVYWIIDHNYWISKFTVYWVMWPSLPMVWSWFTDWVNSKKPNRFTSDIPEWLIQKTEKNRIFSWRVILGKLKLSFRKFEKTRPDNQKHINLNLLAVYTCFWFTGRVFFKFPERQLEVYLIWTSWKNSVFFFRFFSNEPLGNIPSKSVGFFWIYPVQ